MPKTTRKFDWEVYDENNEFVDIFTMSRSEIKDFKKDHPGYTLKEIGYSDDGDDDTWDPSSQKGGNIHSVRIPKRGRKLLDVYETS